MKQNVGPVDAAIRVMVGFVLIILAAWYNSAPLPALGLALLGLFVVGTALNRSCPLYIPFHIDTRPKGAAK
ncbi:MAG TPA: DUF2892 domain-containing protein [Gemmatimonadales bacterium]|nr:DUF2892 domain-containing protein [Gemmatimonadales bacterium]